MSGFVEDYNHHLFPKVRKHRGSNLKNLFDRRNMSDHGSDDLNGIETYSNDNSQDPRPRYPPVSDRVDMQGDRYGRPSNYYDRNFISAQHRTTSIHRNVDRKQTTTPRTIPRNLEERRKWVTHAATLNRQPLVEHAHKILEYMQQDSALMTNDPEGELLRREALRNMPQCLAVKKMIKRKFMTSVSSHSKTLGCGKMLKYQISIWFTHMKTHMKNISYSFELWYNSLKEIEGNFGSGVSTYFKFLRRLFILNLFLTLFSMCFIVVPQIVFSITKSGDNVTIIENKESFSIEDIFTGTGYLTDTVMYYGFYTTGRINGVYTMPEAYFYTMLITFVGTAIILGISMARSYRKSFIETMGGLQNVFAHKIFCGWDFSIAKEEASKLRSSAIYTELKELLSEHLKSYEKITFSQKMFVATLQLSGHLFVFGIVGATGFLMWILLEEHRAKVYGDESNSDNDTYVTIVTAIIINIIMIFFPMLFRFIGSYEGYKSPKTVIIITFFRTLLLEIVVVGILIVFWLTHSDNQICWENSLGQEIYRLLLFDFFFSVIFISLFEVARYYLHKKFKIIAAPEFDISGNTFSVVYNQTLFWLGFYFSPFLGAVIILKLLLTWYVRSWICLSYCVPPRKSWRAAQTETLFLIIIFLSSLLLLLVHAYIMINVPTSNSCGPFQFVDYMHHVFLNAVTELNTNNQVLVIFNFIRKPGVIALVLVAMSMIVYYLRAKSISQRDFVSFLRQRLVLAAQDKEFLLRHISSVSSGDWHHKINREREGGIDPAKLPPNIPKSVRLAEYGDMVPGTSSDDLLVTSSTTSFPFSDSSASEYLRSQGID